MATFESQLQAVAEMQREHAVINRVAVGLMERNPADSLVVTQLVVTGDWSVVRILTCRH